MNLKEEYYNPKGTPLKYDDFKEFEVKSAYDKGQWCFKFPNGYGASIIKRFGSYGYEKDLFELAVVSYDGENYTESHLCYSTVITDDVVGFLNNDEVLDYLKRIKEL